MPLSRFHDHCKGTQGPLEAPLIYSYTYNARFPDPLPKASGSGNLANVDTEDHVGNSLLQIWEQTFGPKTKLFQTSSTRVGQDFEVEVQARF